MISLSDNLAAFSAFLAGYQDSGMVLEAPALRALRDEFDRYVEQARTLESHLPSAIPFDLETR
ncbi:hypothetical protein [Insolitispirillum peregrinum]|uniref:Uncharacterized protein n=1 Tax=Insolitispirillum peregrinum TaxID=80876 RepID=A0A1N7JL98_9PROT|nr:hypothetical protein [Insolitispirillum peregrinum]SIS50142.1 hypothetical protein SAMN05421779_102368 [Insolitispirillum peregrinum]